MGTTGGARTATDALQRSESGRLNTAVAAILREPFARRAHRELLFCLVDVLAGAVGFASIVLLLVPGTAVSAIRGGTMLVVLLVAVVASGAARRLGSVFRRLANRLLGDSVPPPLPAREATGAYKRLWTRL
jgi:hypothetical protein